MGRSTVLAVGLWGIAILAIAFVSMILTPSPDPGSMIAMMIPLILLYELGIIMCRVMENKKPFQPEAVSS